MTNTEPSAFPLTDRQRDAVEHEGGPLIILAGPGTGKTRVITERVCAMVQTRSIEPERILAVTFTNKAAGELRDRLGGSIGTSIAQRIHATTFHSFGLSIVRRFGDVLGLPRDPILIDSSQRRKLMRELIRAQGLYSFASGAGIESAIEHAQTTISQLRNAGIDATRANRWATSQIELVADADTQESIARRTELERFLEATKLFTLFEQSCIQRGWMVFDDLIAWPTKLLRSNQNIAAMIRQNHQHLVVDEFQDVNAAQIALLEALCPPVSNPDLCVVGDDDQSIYAFRGADDRAFARFDSIWSNTRTITLGDNFRSEPPIVDASNTIITNAPAGSRFAPDKVADPNKPDSGESRIELVRLEHDDQAGEAIASMILQMRANNQKMDFGSCAVIARSSLDLARIARVLDLAGIPLAIRERTALMDDSGVKDVLAWARLLVDPLSTPDIRRVLTRPPLRGDPQQIGALITRWKAERARSSADPTEQSDPGALLPWMSARAVDDLAIISARAQSLAEELQQINTESPITETLLSIIKRTGVIHADLPEARERTRRVNAIIGLLGFARSRAPRFEQPADLGAMLRYIDDLDDADKSLGELPEDTVEGSADPTPGNDESGAVQLLTAHASKGLEFDTVFIPRVSSPHGYPKMSGSDNESLPEGLVDRIGDDRDAKQRRADEERRVFYVALTRAERRAVILAKIPKGGRSVNFALELLENPTPPVREHKIRALLDNGHAHDAIAQLEADFQSRKRVRDGIDAIKRRARVRAAGAIDRADTLGTDPHEIERTVIECARTIALASHIQTHAQRPDWVIGTGLESLAEELVESINDQTHPEPDGPGGVQGTLSLSYTQISTYLQCPRCYLLKYVYRLPDEEHAASTTGSAVHAALETFYREWRAADADGLPTPGVEELESLTRKSFLSLWPAHVELDEVRLEQAIAQSRIVWESLHGEQDQILELEREIRVPYTHDGVEHLIKAKIDRIDQGANGAYRVIDYKTGYPKKDLLEPKKSDLQMGIYAMALAALFEDDISGSQFEYWLLQDGTRGIIAGDDLNTKAIQKNIDKAIDGIRAGVWAKGSQCRGDCDILDLHPDLEVQLGRSAASSAPDTGTPMR